jgi:hypothetical protein
MTADRFYLLDNASVGRTRVTQAANLAVFKQVLDIEGT